MSHLRALFGLSILGFFFLITGYTTENSSSKQQEQTPPHILQAILRCAQVKAPVGTPSDFNLRELSDRFEDGTRPVLIQHAKIWTGRKNGTEVLLADILLDKGIIKNIGQLRNLALDIHGSNLRIVDANGAWVTPGIVDVHSHIGSSPSPSLTGSNDDNSFKGTIQPWLRVLDGLHTHDDSYLTSIGGGVTTALVLPGSANAIGGQAYVVKLRETWERSSSSMLLEPPYHINMTFPNPNLPFRWRHIKHSCGENTKGVYYDDTRMDTSWALRQAYNTAKQIKEHQDEYCAQVALKNWRNLGKFPDVLEWEALVDVLRGRVKVNVHCYEAVDLDALVRLSNEFKFQIAVVHHASDAYLVPELLKHAYGQPPAIALFDMARFKREQYRASPFAPRVLAQHGLTVLMKSDHPASDSRFLLYQAQQAYFYGLPDNLAIASVTSNAAEVMGMGHRIGYIQKGYDADLVIWDSHPLALGAAPSQVFIDGIPQLQSPHIVPKPETFQKTPKVPNFDEEARRTILYDGLPPLEPHESSSAVVIFLNVGSLEMVKGKDVKQLHSTEHHFFVTVVTKNGSVVCYGQGAKCGDLDFFGEKNVAFIDLEGGSITPGLVSYGSSLGLENINQEPSTNDGDILDPFEGPVPDVLGGDNSIIRAVDGLMYGTRDALLAYRSGVTIGITAPSHHLFFSGLATAFSLGSMNKFEEGAVIQEVTAIHVSIKHFSKPSVSTQIAVLRRLLLGKSEGEIGIWFEKVRFGKIPLVVETHSADIISTLILLKKDVEAEYGKEMRLTIAGAIEAHLLAKEIAEANVGVILFPSRPSPFPSRSWEQRRMWARVH